MADDLGSAYNKKTILYVGGLDDAVTEANLHAAFIAFGDIVNLDIPRDPQTKRHRGFGFVEFEDANDANEALENMHDNEFFGKVLKVNVARPDALRNKAVWAEADKWYAGLDGKTGAKAPNMIVKIGADGKPVAPDADETDDKAPGPIAQPPGLTAAPQAATAGAAAAPSAEMVASAEAKRAADAAMAAEAAARREAEEGRQPKKPRLTKTEKAKQKAAAAADRGTKSMSARELGLDFKFK